ncbi:PHB depolymerase family esterase [Saccharothrix violaceirubra]|uniref:Polyhydroxybutyrate depolymerase n=1 Tax=Saccharothrix violaceirubra TaxID=413306 RepID=A0A7W7T2E6_9PSEU|nr:PHB depolymerase family esterase [Saccharothrix violaceirubra]MBB4965271.1 polyhydroxybutyrate depolymerase [Saccharothrix violaceirubra]
MASRHVAALVVAALVLGGCSTASGAEDVRTLTVDGRERTYRVHVPRGERLPVVLVLHGGGGDGAQVAAQTGMSAAADAAGYVAVYPDGTGRTSLLTWNAGRCCAYARDEGVDDVRFLSAVLDDVIARYPVDPARVFATGMSNGAMMAYRLGCELSDRIAAVAPVAGALNVDPCRPARPVSVLAVNGTADQSVPYAGGPPSRPVPGAGTWDNRSVADSIGFWTGHDACPAPTRQRDDDVEVTTWSGCADGSRVALYTVEGGTHAWPGGTRTRSGGDPVPPRPDTSRVVLDFFSGVPGR